MTAGEFGNFDNNFKSINRDRVSLGIGDTNFEGWTRAYLGNNLVLTGKGTCAVVELVASESEFHSNVM